MQWFVLSLAYWLANSNVVSISICNRMAIKNTTGPATGTSLNNRFKDGRTNIFQTIDYFTFLLQSDNKLLVAKMQKNDINFVSEIRRVQN